MNHQLSEVFADWKVPGPVCEPGDFNFAAAGLDHGHIYGMCAELVKAGATLRRVFDPDPAKVSQLQKSHPGAEAAESLEAILEDPEIHLVASAAVPSDRAGIGINVMQSGKDYFVDKAPFTSFEHLLEVRNCVAQTGRKYLVYFSERLHNESAVAAGMVIERGLVGRVIQVLGLGPHRLNAPSRPGWFFDRSKYGGILCDIGSHQIEQFLFFSGSSGALIEHAAVGNYQHPEWPELEDFGEAVLLSETGARNYFRVDWFTPSALSTWGDGRTFILGTEGYLELRKYVDVGREEVGNQLYLVNGKAEEHFNADGKIGYPYFGQLILDCLNRTENAMSQVHALKAGELALQAQERADQMSNLEAMKKS